MATAFLHNTPVPLTIRWWRPTHLPETAGVVK
jgi:hypothetical protein